MLERDRELAVLHALIDEARAGTGRLVMLEGPAGIGKSTLLQATVLRARELDVTVLSASGGHLERGFPFGVVRMLFEPLLRDAAPDQRAELLSGAARLAAPALGLDEPDALAARAGETSFAVLHGLYWLAANATVDGPLLIAVDDAHWADGASLGWLTYLGRRLEGLPIVLALAARRDEAGSESELLAGLRAQPWTRMIRPRPLSEAATAQVIGERLGVRAHEEFAQSCQRATGGNPFLVRQLANALAADGVRPQASGADKVGRLGPRTVARALVLRLARLPAAAAALAQAVAILGAGADLALVAALAGCDPSAASDAADALVRAEILEYAPSLGFVHPIVQAAVYEDMGSGRRAKGHHEAALLLERAGAEPARIATHLLETEPSADRWVIATLRAAAHDARARGAPDAAVAYLRRALAEPPPVDARTVVLFELGVAETGAMSLPAAVEHLTDALAGSDDPAEQARVALVLTPILFSTAEASDVVALVQSAITRLGDADRQLTAMLESQLVHLARVELGARRLVMTRITLDPAPVAGDTIADKALLVNLAVEAIMAGEPARAATHLAQQALAGGVLAAGEGGDVPSMFLAAIRVLTLTESFEHAGQLLEDVFADARRRGSVLTFATASAFRSELSYRRGALGEADADAQAALQIAIEYQWQIGLPACVAYAIDTLLERGDTAAGTRLLRSNGLDGALPPLITCNLLLVSRGRLRIACGDVPEGLADLLECGRRMDAWGDRTPVHWQASAALALMALGETQQARQLADDELAYAREFGAPRALGVALRARGLVDDGDAGLGLLREAVAVLEGSGAALEHARALIDLGAALRRCGQRSAAREPLRSGLDLAHRCGATVLSEQARQELAAAGARPRSDLLSGRDALTPSERRVAEMAGTGMSNRDIAQALFVTVRTVETHLSHVYKKLGVRSRDDLRSALG